MDFTIREAVVGDWQDAGQICYDAFKTVSGEHGFPPDFPSVEAAALPLKWMIEHPRFYGAVAVRNGKVIGSIFMDERSSISAIGPITVQPGEQNAGVGKALMKAAMEHADMRGAISIRLLQLSFHNRSLSLYAKLGFDIRGAYGAMYGKPLGRRMPGYDVRVATPADEAACNALSVKVHGHERPGEVHEAIESGDARVVERLGRITAYTRASTTSPTPWPRRATTSRPSSARRGASARPASWSRCATATCSGGAWPRA